MKISKEQLLAIGSLGLTDILDKMNGNQFSEYCKVLDEFVGTFPDQESGLKASFEAKDFGAFSKTLFALLGILTKIHADNLKQSCLKLLEEVKDGKNETIESHLTDFLAAVSALSIDIQLAQYKDTAASEAAADKKPAATDEENGESVQKSILAVDDVSFLLNVLKGALLNTAYKFTGVTSGEAALKFLDKHRPDLFILDIEMPQMNGYELAVKIRERGQTAPIIFLTGNATQDYVLKAIQVGAADFIVKPINKENVLEKIDNHIGS